jgi:DNA-binding IclR family transcriptional regulator
MENNDKSYENQSVIKVFRLIELLSGTEEMSITEIGTAIGLNKGAVFRFISTLRSIGYIEQNPVNEKYRLTSKLFEIGSRVVTRINEVLEAHTVMEQLAQKTNETVHLAILNNGNVVYLDKIDSKHALRIFSRVGNQAPCYCTGLGKVLLAWLSDKEIGKIVKEKKMIKFTETTITSLSALHADLQKIRGRGYAIDNQEHEQGIQCVAAPIRNRTGKVIAAISITWPIIRDNADAMENYKKLIIDAGQMISRRLGFENPTEPAGGL